MNKFTKLQRQHIEAFERKTRGKDMTRLELFEALPMSQRTFLKRLNSNVLPIPFEPLYHQGEYRFELPGGKAGMVKYYRGRKLACYTLIPA